MSPFLGELLGTMLLIILGEGVVAGVVLNKTKSQNSGWIVITIAWGLAVTMGIYAVGKISGAHLNPAVTLALASTGAFPWNDVHAYIAAQMIGAFLGATLVFFHYLPHWRVTEDAALKRAVFCTEPAIRHNTSNLLSEIIGTFILVMGILAIGANEFTQGLNPLVVGLLVVSVGMSLGGTTGYAINPARDLGPRIAHFLLPIPGKTDSNWNYAWIPVVGPVIGGVYGALFYNALFHGKIGKRFLAATVIILLVMLLAFIGDRKAGRKIFNSDSKTS